LAACHGDRPAALPATVIDATPEEAVACQGRHRSGARRLREDDDRRAVRADEVVPASRISAVSVLFAAEFTLAVLEVKTSLVALPTGDRHAADVPFFPFGTWQ